MKQVLTIALTALPALCLAARFAIDGLGANPIEEITHISGEWGLRFVLCSLAITPLRHFLGWKGIAPLRRTFGLAGFCYACIHLATWSFLDLGFDLEAILEDLTERPYVMVGMTAFSILLVLAVTSTRASIRRLGKRWIKLHQMVYIAAILGVIHHFWLTKADYRPAIIHAVLLTALLGARILWSLRHPVPARNA